MTVPYFGFSQDVEIFQGLPDWQGQPCRELPFSISPAEHSGELTELNWIKKAGSCRPLTLPLTAAWLAGRGLSRTCLISFKKEVIHN